MKHDKIDVYLTEQRDRRTLWTFVKIENLMEKFESKVKTHQDAYFRL
jgi:hypothetical protein